MAALPPGESSLSLRRNSSSASVMSTGSSVDRVNVDTMSEKDLRQLLDKWSQDIRVAQDDAARYDRESEKFANEKWVKSHEQTNLLLEHSKRHDRLQALNDECAFREENTLRLQRDYELYVTRSVQLKREIREAENDPDKADFARRAEAMQKVLEEERGLWMSTNEAITESQILADIDENDKSTANAEREATALKQVIEESQEYLDSVAVMPFQTAVIDLATKFLQLIPQNAKLSETTTAVALLREQAAAREREVTSQRSSNDDTDSCLSVACNKEMLRETQRRILAEKQPKAPVVVSQEKPTPPAPVVKSPQPQQQPPRKPKELSQPKQSTQSTKSPYSQERRQQSSQKEASQLTQPAVTAKSAMKTVKAVVVPTPQKEKTISQPIEQSQAMDEDDDDLVVEDEESEMDVQPERATSSQPIFASQSQPTPPANPRTQVKFADPIDNSIAYPMMEEQSDTQSSLTPSQSASQIGLQAHTYPPQPLPDLPSQQQPTQTFTQTYVQSSQQVLFMDSQPMISTQNSCASVMTTASDTHNDVRARLNDASFNSQNSFMFGNDNEAPEPNEKIMFAADDDDEENMENVNPSSSFHMSKLVSDYRGDSSDTPSGDGDPFNFMMGGADETKSGEADRSFGTNFMANFGGNDAADESQTEDGLGMFNFGASADKTVNDHDILGDKSASRNGSQDSNAGFGGFNFGGSGDKTASGDNDLLGGARGSGSQESNGFGNIFGGGNDDEDDGDANQTNGIGGIFGF